MRWQKRTRKHARHYRVRTLRWHTALRAKSRLLGIVNRRKKFIERVRRRLPSRTTFRLPARFLVSATLCLALFLFGAVQLVMFFADSEATRRVNAEVQQLYTTQTPALEGSSAQPQPKGTSDPTAIASVNPDAPVAYQFIGTEMLPEMKRLYQKNDDLIGWLEIPGAVSLPVVYRDEKFYLKRDFNRQRNTSGTIFLDENHPLAAGTQCLVLHGHNMRDGSMFAQLGHYRKTKFLQEHGFVRFKTLYRQETYVVFAVVVTPTDPALPAYVPSVGMAYFPSAMQFDDYISVVTEASLFSIPVDVRASDALLILSTCLDDDRLLVVCRRLRDGETENGLQTSLYRCFSK